MITDDNHGSKWGAIPAANVLPRTDGSGPVYRHMRAALETLGMSDADARLWARVHAYAARGVCWYRTVQNLAKDHHTTAEKCAHLVADNFARTTQGLVLTEQGWKWMRQTWKEVGNE